MDELFGEDEEGEGETTTTRPEENGVLAFHRGTEMAMILHVQRVTKPGISNIPAILQAIDEFCMTRHWMMHVGAQKKSIIEREVSRLLGQTQQGQSSSLTMCEIGSYCGYSCIALCHHFLKQHPSLRYICVEGDPECVKWTRTLVSYAGLDEIVTVIESTVTPELATHFGQSIDVLFIDHDKARYKSDLLVFENLFLKTGAVVVADNTLSFGKPLTDYLDHVRNKDYYSSSECFEAFVEYAPEDTEEYRDGVEISVKR